MEHPLLKKLMHVNRCLNQHFNRRLKPYKLRLSHFRVLHHIFMNEGATQHDLAEILFIDKITMTKMIEKLVREGYVEKRSDRDDKRYNSIYTTAMAKEKQEEFGRIVNEINSMLSNVLTDEENRIAIELLDQLIDQIEDTQKSC